MGHIFLPFRLENPSNKFYGGNAKKSAFFVLLQKMKMVYLSLIGSVGLANMVLVPHNSTFFNLRTQINHFEAISPKVFHSIVGLEVF